MPKSVQLISALLLAWVIVLMLPEVVSLATPEATENPVGSGVAACASGPDSNASASAAGRRRATVPRRPPPARGVEAISEATWTWPRARLNTRR